MSNARTTIATAKDLYEKLYRTFFRREAYGDDQLDWVFDTAVTAWQLVEWYALDNSLDKTATQAQFEQECPELFVCRQLCDGSKHRVLSNAKLQPFDVTTGVERTNDLVGISKSFVPSPDGPTHVEDVIVTPAVIVTDRAQKQWEAAKLFHVVLRFWATKLGLPLP